MSKAYYEIRDEGMGCFYWSLHSGNGVQVIGWNGPQRSEGECLEAINRLEAIVADHPRCILPKE